MTTELQKDVEFERVLTPDSIAYSSDYFMFGSNEDGSPRKWMYRPLNWGYEKQFRKHVMPMLAVLYKPFEVALHIAMSKAITQLTPSILDAIANAEANADEYLIDALHVILLSQQKEGVVPIAREWVEQSAKSREQLMEIVTRQCQLHSIMDKVGESLAGRLAMLASAMGMKIDLVSLKQQWKQVVGVFSAQISALISTVPNAGGQFTASSVENMTQK